ncbi:protein let-653-like [Scylla paramamosain]|uniref:protein let-653-like n=1 Tax=Scylla paramamosain TaxID=85552 RepID=UPI003082C907
MGVNVHKDEERESNREEKATLKQRKEKNLNGDKEAQEDVMCHTLTPRPREQRHGEGTDCNTTQTASRPFTLVPHAPSKPAATTTTTTTTITTITTTNTITTIVIISTTNTITITTTITAHRH